MDKKINRVYLTDKMVLFGIGIGAVYWIIDCLLYVFHTYKDSFTEHLFSPTFDELSTRIVVLCLFLIFGSHAQYSINKREQVEKEVLRLQEANEALKRDLEEQKSQLKQIFNSGLSIKLNDNSLTD